MSGIFELSDEERMIQQTAREFADGEIAPVAAENDAKERFPEDIIKKLGEVGFMGMLVPEEYGGAALGNFCLLLALEEINRACASTGVTVSVHNSLVSSPIIKFGSEELKKKYLPKIGTGEWLGAYALSEAEAGTGFAEWSRNRGDESNPSRGAVGKAVVHRSPAPAPAPAPGNGSSPGNVPSP